MQKYLLIMLSLCLITACGPVERTPLTQAELEGIEKSKKDFMAEELVLDVLYDEREPVNWHVGVKDNGSERHGFASYLCNTLHENGAPTKGVILRIIDIEAVVHRNATFREASLGSANCETFEKWVL